MNDLDGKVAIVTGAAGGIGAVTAQALAEAGAIVVLANLPGPRLEEVAEDLRAKGHSVAHHPVDIADESSVRALVAFALERFGRLDVLDNNAAATTFVAEDQDVLSMSVEIWDRIMAINARGTMLMTKHALPPMLERGAGSIVNISSGLSLAGDLQTVAYGCSKAAVNALTRYVATQYGDRGIRANTIAPGLIRTPTLEAAMPPPVQDVFKESFLVPRLGEPRDIADLVVFLASDRSAYITGQLFSVDGGFFAHVPTLAGVRELVRKGKAP
ncbi:MAG: SDR family NAD(P)-dependent oxidoreductase [Candidatus Binatia bacterium]